MLVLKAKEHDADIIEAEKLLWYKRGSKLLIFTEVKKIKKELVLNGIKEDKRSIILPRYVTGKLFKRSIIKNISFDENVKCYEDALFNHQIKNKFNKYVYVKDVFYNRMQRPSSLINTISVNHIDYIYVGARIKELYEKNNYYNLPIKKTIDKLILREILTILAVKIPLVKISMKGKKRYAFYFLNLIDELSIKESKILINLFKNNLCRTIYYALISHLNIIDISFIFISLFNRYKVNDYKTKNKVLELFKTIF